MCFGSPVKNNIRGTTRTSQVISISIFNLPNPYSLPRALPRIELKSRQGELVRSGVLKRIQKKHVAKLMHRPASVSAAKKASLCIRKYNARLPPVLTGPLKYEVLILVRNPHILFCIQA